MEETKRILLPGDLVAEGPKRLDGCFVEKGNTYAAVVGILSGERVIPLKGFYIPRYDDYVIGIVKNVRFSGYEVEINSPYYGTLSSREMREEFKVGDVISAKIMSVNEVNDTELVEPRRLYGGEILEIEHVKVPRVIGKNASMLAMISEFTRAEVLIGKNGRIYLNGGDIALASLAIIKICREAHTSGLTERVKEFLEKETGTKMGAPAREREEGEAPENREVG